MPVHGMPGLARSSTGAFPSHRSMLRAIAWSRAEFRAACDALPATMDAPERRASRRPRPEGVELCEVAALPDGFRGVAAWFSDRYRAHLPPVALLHLDRFVEIWRFIECHRGRLSRDGLVSTGEDGGTVVDDALLAALVSADYTPGFLGPPEKRCIGGCEAILALAAAVASGEVQVDEFVRQSPEPCETNGTQEDAFDADVFMDAMEMWYELRGRPPSELRARADRHWSRTEANVPRPLEESPVLTLLVSWFAERFDEPSLAARLLQRFMVMAGFIEQHFDRLCDLGFLECEENRLVVTGPLFSILNHLPLAPSPQGGVEPFDLETVIARARVHRERFGADFIVRRKGAASPWRWEGTVRRNDPCPCGSGRKFKRCCRAIVN